MGLKAAVLTIGAVGLLATKSSAQVIEPSVLVLRAFCEPTFSIEGKAQRSGTGFLLERQKTGRRTFLFTAQHLFSFSPQDMPKRVTSAECAAPQEARRFAAGPAVTIPGAHPMGALNTLKDVAAFPINGWSPGVPLAQTDVLPGDHVWLLARVKSGAETDRLLHRAVVGRSNGFLAYRFDDQTIGLDQTSGAAVLNGVGEVVGLNVGYTRMANGQLIGVADRLATLRSVVDALP